MVHSIVPLKTYRYFDMYSGTAITRHFGHPALIETKLMPIAKIPVRGEKLQDCVLVHPRYAQDLKSSDYEIVLMRVFRRGKGLDILLDESFEHEGREYAILNFKGAGADADYEQLMCPGKWYDPITEWRPTHIGDPIFRRPWGVLGLLKARAEFSDLILPWFGIPQIPHVAVNPFPGALNLRVCMDAETKRRFRFGQLVRAYNTNVRMSERNFQVFDEMSIVSLVNLARVYAEINATVVRAQVQLARKGRRLVSIGSIDDNRLVDGKFTDAENHTICDFDAHEAESFVDEVFTSAFDLIKHIASADVRETMLQVYLESTSSQTGLDFSVEKRRRSSTKLLLCSANACR
ncbi:MAG: hypothetical protein AABW86_01580 [Candidatus Micrarchaeota archaeon]